MCEHPFWDDIGALSQLTLPDEPLFCTLTGKPRSAVGVTTAMSSADVAVPAADTTLADSTVSYDDEASPSAAGHHGITGTESQHEMSGDRTRLNNTSARVAPPGMPLRWQIVHPSHVSDLTSL